MRRLAFALMLCVIAIGASAQATALPKAPPVSAQPQGNGGGEQSAQEPQSTAKPTIVVNVQPSPKTEAEANQEESERKEKAGLDRRMVELTADLTAYTKWLAYATIILTVVTAGLFVFAVLQSRDAREVGRAARQSADAARLSAQTAIAVEGAKLVVSMVSFEGEGSIDHKEQVRRGVVHASVRNYGRSPAFIRETCIEVFRGRDLPIIPPYRSITPVIDVTLEDRQVHPLEPGRPIHGPLDDDDVRKVISGEQSLWAFGYVAYGDVLGVTQKARFCRKIAASPATGKVMWISAGPTAYTKSS